MALYKYHYIELDTKRSPHISLQNIVAGETGNRLWITVTNNGDVIDMSEKQNGEFIYRVCLVIKSDLGVRRQDSATENSGIAFIEDNTGDHGKVNILLSKDSFTAGKNRARLEIYSKRVEEDDTLIVSAEWTFDVEGTDEGDNVGLATPLLVEYEQRAKRYADIAEALFEGTVVEPSILDWMDAHPDEALEYIGEWLDEHPEATTTVEDGAITKAKLNAEVMSYFAKQSDMNMLLPTNLADVSYTSGKYVNFKDGALVNSTAGSASDYIDVDGVAKILYSRVCLTQTTSTNWGIAFYDSSKNYISGVRAKYKESTLHYEVSIADVPASAKYVRITKRDDLGDPVLYNYNDTSFAATNAKSEEVNDNARIYNFPADDMFPINVCHRGLATSGLPENTMVAFKDAVSKGWKFLETDIRSTSDGVWVLLHDSTINRTARNEDGTTISGDVAIASITYEEALEYDFGIKEGATYAGTKIPTLDAFLNYCNKAHVYPVLEVKNSSITQEEADAVWAIVEKYGMQNRIMWLCASYGGVEYFLEKYPYAPAIHTSSATWTEIDISALTPESEKPYSYRYKTGKNKVFHERLVSSIASKSLMDNMVDYYRYFGMYGGVYCPTTVSAIEGCSDRLDMCTSQYIKYSDAKEEEIE